MLAAKTPILITAASLDGVPVSFLWAPTTDYWGVTAVERDYQRAIEYGYAHVVLVEISVPADQHHRAVSDYIDGILEQIIERRVGRIVAFHDRWGERPKPPRAQLAAANLAQIGDAA